MATVELTPGEEYDFEGVKIHGDWVDGELQTFASLDGWKVRGFDLNISNEGGDIDFLEYADGAPQEENDLVYAAIANFAREKSREMVDGQIIVVRDPSGNML